jgi:hypothetical protein
VKHQALCSYARRKVLIVCSCGYVGKQWPIERKDHAWRLWQGHVNRAEERRELAAAAGERSAH